MSQKVYSPEEIQDSPLPGAEPASFEVSTPTSGSGETKTSQPSKIQNSTTPSKRIAVELLSTRLNTKSKQVLGEFQLADKGGFRVGKWVKGVSGEVVFTPVGITAKNKAGVTTFSLVGEDGSAVFAGEVQAGSLISGAVAVGDGDILIDGKEKRMIFFAEDGLPAIIIGNA